MFFTCVCVCFCACVEYLMKQYQNNDNGVTNNEQPEAENIHQKTNNANANDDIEFIENKTIHLFDMEFQLLCGHTIESEMENREYQSNRDQQERSTEEEPTAKEHHDNEEEKKLKELCVLWNTVPDEITLQQQASTISYKFVMTLDKKYHLAKQEMMDGKVYGLFIRFNCYYFGNSLHISL